MFGRAPLKQVQFPRHRAWVANSLLPFNLRYYWFRLSYPIYRDKAAFIPWLKTNASLFSVEQNLISRGGAVSVVGCCLKEGFPLLHRKISDGVVEVSFERRQYRGVAHLGQYKVLTVNTQH